MNERYPHLRFLIDAAPVLAGALALVVFLGGTMQACHRGGIGGLFSFLVAAAVAALVYVIVRAKLEFVQAVLDLENGVHDLNARRGDAAQPGEKPGA